MLLGLRLLSTHVRRGARCVKDRVPLVVVWAVASNALMLLVVGITYIFCLGNVDKVLDTPTYQPVIQVIFDSTQSVAGTSVMIAVLIIILLSACVGQVATAARQMWSFARDKGKVHFCRFASAFCQLT